MKPSNEILETILSAKAIEQDLVIKAVEVTPEMAAIFLSKNDNNRPINSDAQKKYEISMLAGDWTLNGETVVFDYDGELLNGQHRLRAILATKKTMPLVLVFGVSPGAFATMDCGMKRSVAQIFAMRQIPYSASLAAVAKAMYIYDFQGGGFQGKAAKRIPASVIIKYALDNNLLVKSVAYAYKGIHPRYAPTTAMAFSHYIFRRIDPVEADVFIAKIGWDEIEDEDKLTPIIRDHFREIAIIGGTHKMFASAFCIFVAWNAYRTGATLKREQLFAGRHTRLPEPL